LSIEILFEKEAQAKSSNAEVDYLLTSGSTVYPAEVKSGKTGTLKSVRLFLKEHPSCPLGIRFSMQKLSFHDRILSIPLYMVKHWERIVKSDEFRKTMNIILE
jgi:hypothetical protein